ncbi:MAG TPA: hypothetical protein VHK27_12780 [Gammaproteobacteria bacterium]|nr:hypothetical protein [Gammaproteobacteria bacterium]
MVDATPRTNDEAPGRRPAHFIAGVIEKRPQVESAVNELNSLGFAEGSILVLHGESGADAIRGRDQEPGFTGVLRHCWIRLSEFLSNQLDNVQRHIEAAERGNYVIVVPLQDTDTESRDQVHQVLKLHGGYDIILVGLNSSEQLTA